MADKDDLSDVSPDKQIQGKANMIACSIFKSYAVKNTLVTLTTAYYISRSMKLGFSIPSGGRHEHFHLLLSFTNLITKTFLSGSSGSRLINMHFEIF